MPNVAPVLDELFAQVKAAFDKLSPPFQDKLHEYEANARLIVANVVGGAITVAQGEQAAKREANAVASTLIVGAVTVEKESAKTAINIASAVLGALLKIAVA